MSDSSLPQPDDEQALLAAPDAEQTVPLFGPTRITVRRGGVNVRQTPSLQSERLGELPEGSTRTVQSLIFSEHTWLGTGWPQESEAVRAWIAGEFTDFPRSAAYTQVSGAWYESRAVLNFRRALARDLLRVQGADQTRLDQVNTLRGAELRDLEQTLTSSTVPAGVVKFSQLRAALGLPDPFEYFPVHATPPAKLNALTFEGFGPNTFAFENWPVYYEATRGLHSGVDYNVAEGSPLIAVADGEIVPFDFLGDPAEESLALRPYLPEAYRQPDGSRVLSNVIVGYGHLTGDPTSRLVHPGDEVAAGQIIGTSGWPVYTRDDGSIGIQANNAHLHMEVHLVTDGQRALGSRTPFNPLLFWSPRLVAWQARLAARPPYPTGGQPWGRLGFFSIGCFSYEPSGVAWNHAPTREAPWPEGIYDLEGMLRFVQIFGAYPLDGSSPF